MMKCRKHKTTCSSFFLLGGLKARGVPGESFWVWGLRWRLRWLLCIVLYCSTVWRTWITTKRSHVSNFSLLISFEYYYLYGLQVRVQMTMTDIRLNDRHKLLLGKERIEAEAICSNIILETKWIYVPMHFHPLDFIKYEYLIYFPVIK
jgi:hypothetical protein